MKNIQNIQNVLIRLQLYHFILYTELSIFQLVPSLYHCPNQSYCSAGFINTVRERLDEIA